MIKPNRCSKCGRKPFVETYDSMWPDERKAHILCNCGNKSDVYESEDKAISAWNKENNGLSRKSLLDDFITFSGNRDNPGCSYPISIRIDSIEAFNDGKIFTTSGAMYQVDESYSEIESRIAEVKEHEA